MKNILLLAVGLTMAMATHAQSESGFWSYSLRTGYSASYHTGDVVSETTLTETDEGYTVTNPASDQIRHGFHVDLQIEHTFGRAFGMGLEFGYVQKGSKIVATDIVSGGSSTSPISSSLMQRQDYLRAAAPVSFFIPIKSRRIILRGGPYYASQLQSKIIGTYKDDLYNYTFEEETQAPDPDYGYLAGLGYWWEVSEYSFMFVEARYNKSLKTITGINDTSYGIESFEISIALGFK